MSAHRYRSTWRSLIFNRQYDDSGIVDDESHLDAAYSESDYRLEALDIGRVSQQDYRELRQWLEGSDAAEAYEGVRLLTGRGRILGSTPTDLEDKTWAMFEAFSPAASRIAANAIAFPDPPGVLPFDFKRDSAGGAKALRFYARPAIGRPLVVQRMREGLARPFAWQLIAFSPFAYDSVPTTTVLGDLAGGNNTVTNPGNMYSPLVRWKITMGSAGTTSHTLTNTTTGQALVLNLNGLGNGQVVYVVVDRSLIKNVDGTVDRYSLRTSGFASSMYLAAGANTITFTPATNIASVACEFRGAYA